MTTPPLPTGLVAFVKRDCPTCELIDPVLGALAGGDEPLTVYTQDDTGFPESVEAIDDLDLTVSWHHDIETVPTLMRVGDDGVITIDDERIFEAQSRLVNDGDLGARQGDWKAEVVEPAGAAAFAAVHTGALREVLPADAWPPALIAQWFSSR